MVTEGNRIRLLVIDDHPFVRAGLRALVEPEPDVEYAGEASTAACAARLVRETEPDIASIDLSLPDLNGIVLARRLVREFPGLRLITLTMHEDRAHVREALQAGVRGYVVKRSACDTFLHAVRAVASGGIYLDPAVAGQMIGSDMCRDRKTLGSARDLVEPGLTDREADVLRLVAFGFTCKEIAARLDISVKSVETYKARATDKLGLHTRAHVVRYAAMQGWLAEL